MKCCGGGSVNDDKFSQFSDACYNGNVEKMKQRLKVESKGRNILDVVNKRDDSENKLTPLHKAVQKGKADAIIFLLENNADPRALTKSGESPLHIAAFHRNVDATKELLKTSAKQDVNTKEAVMEMTPLHVAVWRGCPEITDLLMKNGADPAIKDKNGQDVFEIAEFWARQEKDNMGSPTARHDQTLSILNAARA